MTRVAPQHSAEEEVTAVTVCRTMIGIGRRGGVQGAAIGRTQTGAGIAPALQRPAQRRPPPQKNTAGAVRPSRTWRPIFTQAMTATQRMSSCSIAKKGTAVLDAVDAPHDARTA